MFQQKVFHNKDRFFFFRRGAPGPSAIMPGLDDLIEVRVGDAFDTLKAEIGGKIEVLLLDGWKELYLPMLEFLEPRLSPGALIIADDLDVEPKDIGPYLDYVRNAKSGYVSVELPIGDRIEVSLRD